MEGWVDLGALITPRPRTELTTARSEVRHPATRPPRHVTSNEEIPTGKYESDESKEPVAAPEDDACERDVPSERLDLHKHWHWLLLDLDDHWLLLLLYILRSSQSRLWWIPGRRDHVRSLSCSRLWILLRSRVCVCWRNGGIRWLWCGLHVF